MASPALSQPGITPLLHRQAVNGVRAYVEFVESRDSAACKLWNQVHKLGSFTAPHMHTMQMGVDVKMFKMVLERHREWPPFPVPFDCDDLVLRALQLRRLDIYRYLTTGVPALD